MGRDGGKIQCPRGVTIREHAHAQRVIVAFTYQGIECREVTGLPATPAGIKVAANLRGEIIRKIENGVFVYSDYFPNGSKLSLFGRPATKITVGDLLDKQTSAYQAALHNGAIKRSTYNCYIKDIHRLRNDWQNVLVSDATPTKLKNWISLLGRSRKGITNLLTPLHSAFEDALNDGLIEFDPFSRISLKKLLRDYAKRSRGRTTNNYGVAYGSPCSNGRGYCIDDPITFATPMQAHYSPRVKTRGMLASNSVIMT